jgi:putative transcriptional regulator
MEISSSYQLESPEGLQVELAHRLRALRVSRNLTQEQLADKARLSRKAVRNLEQTGQASITTLMRSLHALDAAVALDAIAPRTSVSPIQIFRGQQKRQRVRRKTSAD